MDMLYGIMINNYKHKVIIPRSQTFVSLYFITRSFAQVAAPTQLPINIHVSNHITK